MAVLTQRIVGLVSREELALVRVRVRARVRVRVRARFRARVRARVRARARARVRVRVREVTASRETSAPSGPVTVQLSASSNPVSTPLTKTCWSAAEAPKLRRAAH